MRRVSKPTLSTSGQQALEHYTAYLEHEVDSSAATVRNYLSDLQQFIAWCEATWARRTGTGTELYASGHDHPVAHTLSQLLTAYARIKTSLCQPGISHHKTLRCVGDGPDLDPSQSSNAGQAHPG